MNSNQTVTIYMRGTPIEINPHKLKWMIDQLIYEDTNIFTPQEWDLIQEILEQY